MGFAILQPFRVYPCQACMLPGGGLWPIPGVPRVPAPPTASSLGEPPATYFSVPQTIPAIGCAHIFEGVAESHLIPLPSLHGRDGSSFPDSAEPHDTINSESVVGLKPGHSGVVIGYHIDEFTHTWSVEQFTA